MHDPAIHDSSDATPTPNSLGDSGQIFPVLPRYQSPYAQPDKPWRDVRRPDLPYYCGQILPIKRHTPMEPFGRGYFKGGEHRPKVRILSIDGTNVEWCLNHPLIETPPHPDQSVHQLHIGKPIVRGEDHGAQLVHCKLNGEGPDLVAKIYDPLYYPFDDDITWLADSDYAHETAAYEDLQKAGHDGVVTPKYYGSWTFDLPLLEPSSNVLRPVRMILMQWIDAVSMWALTESDEAYKIPPQRRLDMLAKAMEYNSWLQLYGVETLDWAPRNILVSGHDTHDFRIWLIDFNQSVARSRPRAKKPLILEKQPISPLYLFWGTGTNEFINWLPVSHRFKIKVMNGWLMSVWGNGKAPEFGPYPEPEDMEDLDMSEGKYEYMDPLPDVGKHTDWG